MTLTVELADDIATHANATREALECFVIECYRTEKLYPRQCREMLGMGRIEFNDFLFHYGVTEGAYDEECLLQDIATGDRLRAEGLIPG